MNENEFKKGVLYGILITVTIALAVNAVYTGYRVYVRKDINHEAKAKTIYELMEKNYVGDIDKDKIFEGIYLGMLYESTDKYSTYITAEDYSDYKIKTSGNYVGIGALMTIDINDYSIVVNTVYDGSPAAKAGICTGDKLIEVDGTKVNYDNYADAVDMIRGEVGTKVKIKIFRPTENATYDTEVTREDIDQPTVAGAVIDDNIGYIAISGFETVTYDQYMEIYKKLKSQGIKALIIDLRENPGGLLETVSKIADEIIPEGTITYTEDKNGEREYLKSAPNEIDIPLAVLVNEHSASASELLTAAIKDTGKGVIIGKNTYGKGVVQTTFPLTDGSAVKLTTARYYTPNGICIDGKGVAPDIEVEEPAGYELPVLSGTEAQYNTTYDTQLNRAVEEMKKSIS